MEMTKLFKMATTITTASWTFKENVPNAWVISHERWVTCFMSTTTNTKEKNIVSFDYLRKRIFHENHLKEKWSNNISLFEYTYIEPVPAIIQCGRPVTASLFIHLAGPKGRLHHMNKSMPSPPWRGKPLHDYRHKPNCLTRYQQDAFKYDATVQ